MTTGLLPHTVAFFVRWHLAKHVPLSNMYEYLSVMGWMAVVMLLAIHFRHKRPLVGALISPIVFMLMVTAALLPKDVNQSLMPALQSVWLHIHVSLAAIGSGCFMVAYAISSIYLFRKFAPDQLNRRIMPAMLRTTLVYLLLLPVILTLVIRGIGLNPPTPESYVISESSGLNLGGVFVLLGAGYILGCILTTIFWSGKKGCDKSGFGGWLFSIITAIMLFAGLFVGFLIRIDFLAITHNLHSNSGEIARSSWLIFEFIGVTYSIGLLLALIILPIVYKISTLVQSRSSIGLTILDEISYKTVSLGYPLYTIGALFAGAIWAEQAWGSFWSWDPKEVGAMIIWLFYSGYLHARYQRGWSGSKAAMLVIIGFLMVVLSFLGNYFFGGLHAYA